MISGLGYFVGGYFMVGVARQLLRKLSEKSQ